MPTSDEEPAAQWEERVGRDGLAWIVAPTPTDEQTPHECWFCGTPLIGANRAKEHVFPQWLAEALGARSHGFAVAWNAPVDRDAMEQRTMTVGSHVAGNVCKGCNNGWMSRLEGTNKATIVRLACDGDSPDDLADEEKGGLARWAVKTLFAAQATAIGPKLVPRAHRHLLAMDQMPPVAVIVRRSPVDLGLGWKGSQDWYVDRPGGTRDHVAALVERSYKLVMTVGHLVLAVSYWPDARWSMLISAVSHRVLNSADLDWRIYPYGTDRHGVPPTQETETVDMTVGLRVVHPALGGGFRQLLPRAQLDNERG